MKHTPGFEVCCVGVFLLSLCSACVPLERAALDQSKSTIVLLDPEAGIDEDWEHRRLRRADTRYEAVESELGHTIRATGNDSASILYRLFDPLDAGCRRLRWSWLVSQPQPGSNLHIKGSDDVAASVFVLFGDPGIFRDRAVPTLKYVWANHRHQLDEIIAGPYHPEQIRTRVLRVGGSDALELLEENVDLAEDYLRIFGGEPANGIYGIAIFTDNDDTREPIIADYGKIELICDR